MEIVFATNNTHKLEEVRVILGSDFEVLSLLDLGFTAEIEETSDTLEGNALLKAKCISEIFKKPCFSDDSGLEVEALDNAPGVYSARYGGEQGNHEKNIAKLLLELQGQENRKARFRTVICYINNLGEITYFDGSIQGVITRERRGNKGFGYDPVFLPDSSLLTFAEMDTVEKNNISHRAQAVEKFSKFLMQ